jgi:hypothetical protein
MSHVAKIILKIILGRLKCKVKETVDNAQCGLRKGRGRSNPIFVLRSIIERMITNQ